MTALFAQRIALTASGLAVVTLAWLVYTNFFGARPDPGGLAAHDVYAVDARKHQGVLFCIPLVLALVGLAFQVACIEVQRT